MPFNTQTDVIMAGDWIKMRVALTYDLKVMQIARILNLNSAFLNSVAPGGSIPTGGCDARALHTYVIGALHRFWCAAQEVSADGKLGSLTRTDVDALVGCIGFCDALIAVGWIEEIEEWKLQVHNWHEHNGESAKKRAMTQKRMSKHRELKRESVAQVKRASVTREEKRREEKKEGRGTATTFTQPTLEEVSAYCRERKNHVDPQRFLDHYSANGWRVGKNAMKDWRAAVRTWEKNEFGNGKPPVQDRPFTPPTFFPSVAPMEVTNRGGVSHE